MSRRDISLPVITVTCTFHNLANLLIRHLKTFQDPNNSLEYAIPLYLTPHVLLCPDHDLHSTRIPCVPSCPG